MENIILSRITSASPEFGQLWNLREEVLRKPLGRSLRDDDLSRDKTDTIFIAVNEGRVIGCVFLHPIDNQVAQLRAMAVYEEWRGKGIGRLLVQEFETFAWQQKFEKIILHARKVALGFYKGMGYTVSGEEFTEVGIPHFMMEKNAPIGRFRAILK